MIATIAKRFTFDAAHHLPGMPEGHKCKRPHGHTYEVELVLRGPVDKHTGMFIDYGVIADAWIYFDEKLDHRDLNEIPGLGRASTTERLCGWIWQEFQVRAARGDELAREVIQYLHVVRIKESTTTWCEVSRAESYEDAGL